MNTLTVLTKVRDILEHECNWTQKSWARNIYGHACKVEDYNVCQWCIGGALRRFSPEGLNGSPGFLIILAIKELYPELYHEAHQRGMSVITVFNDSPKVSHSDVLSVLNRAIQAAMEEGGVHQAVKQ